MSDLAEQGFVQDCLTHRLYPDRPCPAPPGEMDWAKVYGLLARHGLTRLFYRLGRDQAGLWPPSLQNKLRTDYEGSLLWGEQCRGEVEAVLRALGLAGLPVLVLKGWALIPSLYGDDPGLRMCGDLDLLVRPQDAARAEQLLDSLGYSASLEPWPGFDRRYRNGRVWQRPRRPWPFKNLFAVALHWQLLDTPFWYDKIDTSALFDRSLPLRVSDVEARALAGEDHLVYACGHLALHHDYDDALYRYYELACLIQRAGPAFDWAAVAARAAGWRLVLPVQRVLSHLRTLWPAIVPATAWEQIAALRPSRCERLVHGWVVRARQNHTARALLAWLTMPGLGRRWRYLLEHAFPGPAYLRQRYGPPPAGLWPLHYVRRIVLAARYGLGAIARRAVRWGSDRPVKSPLVR
jgi:Uncharacterised nucleotidyltransferase